MAGNSQLRFTGFGHRHRMKTISCIVTAAGLALASPAHATGGFICRSAAGEISLTVSHTVAPVIVAGG